ncbi:MAG: tyrosine-type recombinase/integrase, partial [Oscillospiraceae bacterium]
NRLNLVCCREDGLPLGTNVLQHQFRDVLKTDGLPPIRFHDLRHTNATIMLRNKVPAKIVSSMLGHSSIGITMDTYSHVMTDMQEGATGVMNALFEKL